MTQTRFGTVGRALTLGLCVLVCGSCGTAVRQGRGASILVIDLLMGASGATPTNFGTVLQSDVVTNIKLQNGGVAPAIYEDNGQASLRFVLKDPMSTTGATTANEVTVTSYHVRFIRADGRNTPGVDVPYAFDGAVTGTVKVGVGATLQFVLVRAQAKLEPPLLALRGLSGSVLISTIAEVTFYGHDQAGNQVSATGTISVEFGDWADQA